MLLHADCLDALRALPSACAQLIYLDPPFNTRSRRTAKAASYDDAFGSGRDYVEYMRPRVTEMWRLLADTGSLFFHCDWRMSHHVRPLLDEVFFIGADGRWQSTDDGRPTTVGRRSSAVSRQPPATGVFVNEIIWRYGLGAARVGRQLLTKHDTIFWYARTSSYVFNVIRGEPTKAMLAKYCHIEPDGRRYMMSYGKRYYMKGGKPLDDVWDLPAIAATSGERLGYPTQKPLALLERVITLASNPGGLVIDPFCGSGTTLAAARALGRDWIGIDANADAIAIARARMARPSH
jgi:site-specific DNA-methyltransferase (adenine-specific)